MAIQLDESFEVAAPLDRVWAFLRDPARVVVCLPGAELQEVVDDRTYRGAVKVKVGPITAAYAGLATLTQIDDAARRMQMVGEGTERGGSGSAKMTMTGTVTGPAAGPSQVEVHAEIEIAGKIMQFGRGLVESVNRQVFAQFALSVQETLAAEGAALASAPAQSAADGSPAPGAPAPMAAAPQPPTATPRQSATPVRIVPLLFRAILDWFRRLFRS